jgi:hypothetical protein
MVRRSCGEVDRMSRTKALRGVPVTEAAAHGACVVCTALRHHQTNLVEVTGVPKARHLCNHHAWSLARSAPAALAAQIYAQVLAERRQHPNSQENACTFCSELRREEKNKLDEVAEQMKVPSFVAWMRRSGTLCLWHGERLSHKLPPKTQSLIEEVVARTLDEIELDLQKYVVQARNGQHAGAGVLGRVAEFLVCQRGIPGEEKPC